MKKFQVGNSKTYCNIQKYRRSKKLALSVSEDGTVKMSIPQWVTYKEAKDFLERKKKWVLKQVERTSNRSAQSMLCLGTREDYLENKEIARNFVQKRIDHFNSFYLFDYQRISIRNQRMRWGSCSGKGNLNFNWRIIYLTGEQADYLIVHELCHLKHLNHSHDFWQCVGKTIPNYRQISKTLRNL